jgi:hypothetical protein
MSGLGDEQTLMLALGLAARDPTRISAIDGDISNYGARSVGVTRLDVSCLDDGSPLSISAFFGMLPIPPVSAAHAEFKCGCLRRFAHGFW